MKAKVLIRYHLCEAGHHVHRIYLEPDFDQAEEDLKLLQETDNSDEWELQECDIFGGKKKDESKEQILSRYVHHFYSKRMAKAVMIAMDDYAERCTDVLYELFERPRRQLKPLEDLWRKEMNLPVFALPDTTEFYKWITNKIMSK